MTVEEINKVYDQMRAQGASDEDLVGMCYLLYQEDKIDTNQLKDMIKVLGYQFTPEFEAMSEEDKHEKGWEMSEEKAEGVSKEEVEDAKEVDKEEDEGGKEEIETEKKEEVKEEPKDDKDGEESEEKSEDDERKEASNLFGLNLNKKQ